MHRAPADRADELPRVQLNRFDWTADLGAPDRTVTPVQNGGLSLRSQRFMRALVEHPQIRVEIPPPDTVEGEPLAMRWHHNALLEDVQLSGVLRPALEAVGLRFAPLALARDFASEHAGGQFAPEPEAATAVLPKRRGG